MTVRMVKMNLIDGEYQVLARQNPELNEALVPFGTSGNSVVQINGSGIQEAEFNDGFRMSIRSSQPMTMNTVAKNGVSTSMLSALGPNVQTVSK